MTASPLGPYSSLVASLTSVILVLAAIAAHTGLLQFSDTAWLDTAAGLAIGVILGQNATTNGAAKIAASANLRLDAIGAPAAASNPPPPRDPPAP